MSRPADPLTLPNAARPAPMEVQSCQFPGGAAGVVRSACFAFDTKNGAKAADRHWFKQEFCASVAYLEAWLAKQDALPAGEGFAPELPPMMALGAGLFGRPGEDFTVFEDPHLDVSSKALEFVWSGSRGQMRFRSREITSHTSGIVHELTHVYLPNANRLLAEGLAVYLQSLLSSVPSLPNEGADLHAAAWTPNSRGEIPACMLGLGQSIGNRDRVLTPDPLLEKDYTPAGSFVRYLIEEKGMSRFALLYGLTPLGPVDPRRPYNGDRWKPIYGKSLQDLRLDWLTFLRQKSPFIAAEPERGTRSGGSRIGLRAKGNAARAPLRRRRRRDTR